MWSKFSGERISFSTSGAGKFGYAYAKQMNAELYKKISIFNQHMSYSSKDKTID